MTIRPNKSASEVKYWCSCSYCAHASWVGRQACFRGFPAVATTRQRTPKPSNETNPLLAKYCQLYFLHPPVTIATLSIYLCRDHWRGDGPSVTAGGSASPLQLHSGLFQCYASSCSDFSTGTKISLSNNFHLSLKAPVLKLITRYRLERRLKS